MTRSKNMGFVSRVANLLKQSESKHRNASISSLNSPPFQALKKTSSPKLFVGGLAYAIDEIRLRIPFQKYGEVIQARVIINQYGMSRGFGFVTYASIDAANNALQDMDGKELHGRRISVGIFQEKPAVGSFESSSGGGK